MQMLQLLTWVTHGLLSHKFVKCLKGSGSVVAICPTMNQLEKLVSELTQNEFTDIECSEQILRTIDAREGKTRHSFQGVGHTTYLCFARKAFFEKSTKKTNKKLVNNL